MDIAFLDFSKTFDSVSLSLVKRVMQLLGFMDLFFDGVRVL